MKRLKTGPAAAALVALSSAAQAALASQRDGTVLGTNTKLIWLQDWNKNGTKNWRTQKAWAETTLDVFADSNDWRLPEIGEYHKLSTDCGDLTKVGAFTNVQSNRYRSGTAHAKNPGSTGSFDATGRSRGCDSKSHALYAMAVHLEKLVAGFSGCHPYRLVTEPRERPV